MFENIFWYLITFGCGCIVTLVFLIKFNCRHVYEVIESMDVSYAYNGSKAIKKVYVNRCKHCGKLKKVEIK